MRSQICSLIRDLLQNQVIDRLLDWRFKTLFLSCKIFCLECLIFEARLTDAVSRFRCCAERFFLVSCGFFSQIVYLILCTFACMHPRMLNLREVGTKERFYINSWTKFVHIARRSKKIHINFCNKSNGHI